MIVTLQLTGAANSGTNDSQTAQIGASGAGKKLVAAKKLVNGDAVCTTRCCTDRPYTDSLA